MLNKKLKESKNYWIEVMKENEIFYHELDLKEKRNLRKEKLKKINNESR